MDERVAWRTVRRQPKLLARGGFVVGVAAVAAGAGLAAAGAGEFSVYDDVVGLAVGVAVGVLLLPYPVAGLTRAALTRVRGDGDGPPTERGSAAGRVSGVTAVERTFLATCTSWAVGLSLTVVLFLLLLTVDAGVDYVRYLDGWAGSGYDRQVAVAAALLLVAGVAVRLALAFDVPAILDGSVDARRGWLASLDWVAAQPRAFLRFAAGRALLLSPAVALSVGWWRVLGEGANPSTATVVLAVVALVASAAMVVLSVTLAAVHRATVYDRAVEPALADGRASGPWRRGGERPRVAALVVLLVSAAVVGGVAMRVGDVRPTPEPAADPVEGDAGRVLETARQRARTTSHVVVVRVESRNASGGLERRVVMRRVLDRPDRQFRQRYRVWRGPGRPDRAFTLYLSDRTLAGRLSTGGEARPGVPFYVEPGPYAPLYARERGAWAVVALPGYHVTGAATATQMPTGSDGDWRVANRSADAVTLVRESTSDPGQNAFRAVVERRQQVVVDAQTGRPRRVVTVETQVSTDENGTVTHRSRVRTVKRYSRWGSASVERPDGVGGPSPAELVWDLLLY